MSQSALIYARYSTSEQRGFSIERQQTLGAQFAVEQGWTVEKMIADEGRSAFHGANRYEGASLHKFEIEARNGLHAKKVLVVENIDRLSRQGAKAAAQLIWGLNENGVDVATYHDQHIYRANGSGEMLDIFKLVILAQQAHEESSKKSKRTAASWQKRFERIANGTQTAPIPNTPLWVDRVLGKMVLNEHRVKVLNEIYDLYIDGVGIHKIVTILHDRNEPSWTPPEQRRGNNGWFYSYIYRLLTKRTVLGEYATNDGKIIATDFWPQAVTAEKWNRVQAALAVRKSNRKKETGSYNRNLLQGIVVCDQCGGGAHFRHQIDKGQTYTKKSGEVVTYKRNDHRRLRCDRARRKHDCDNGTILNYDVVEATVLDEMLPQLVDRRLEDTGIKEARERIAELGRLRDVNQSKLNNLIEALADGGSKSIVQRVAVLEAEIEEYAGQIEAAQQNLAVQLSRPSHYDDTTLIELVREEINSERDEVRTYARGRANMALRRLIKRIAIKADGTFRIEPDDYSWWLFDEKGTMLEGAYVPS
ncbi:recombinase family protein [Sphingomonas baiyangensis]|uniref:Recombinase family protein n=1 Tax=Sphingomonas baiyangensis TaxID=2572576 RepID=A0A4U1L2L0_9SPHN|nr:recombinase family protein [Sphingomonas baiyangensis]TKD50265.1 recombinase family protein [Sphingomonas baiyangensis]